ncbi:MAG: pitrilysin family protein [Thermoguttaceae bacterium]
MEFLNHTLPNGLEIVAECNSAAYSTALGFFVRTGARDENDAVAGVSHFLEHMVFKGTPSRSADDVNREFDEMGAHYNAFTNEENTVYYAAVLPEHQDRAAGLLADILRPSLREEDFNTEKQVILEEIQMYEDQPPFGADDKCRAMHYGAHPLGRSVLGTSESIRKLPVAAMRDYFRSRYSPSNIVLAGAGRIDFDALVRLADRLCGNWERTAAPRTVEPAACRDGFEVLRKETASQQYLLQLSAGPAAEDPDRYAAKLLATVLGDDSGSRLYWDLIDPGLAEHVSLGHSEHEGAGMMMTYMTCDPEYAADNLRLILEVYRQAEADGITPEELEQAKSKVRSRVVLSSERPRGRLFAVGSDWLYRHEYRPVELELDTVSGISAEACSAVLAKYPLTRGTMVTIGPLAELRQPR